MAAAGDDLEAPPTDRNLVAVRDAAVGRRQDRNPLQIFLAAAEQFICQGLVHAVTAEEQARSEERRGGKKGRSRGSPDPLKKKKNHRAFCINSIGRIPRLSPLPRHHQPRTTYSASLVAQYILLGFSFPPILAQ